ncbi:MAG: polyprenol monophosphomannose synthase [Chlorobiaceae bacterium]|nr:polyprenol monophosphomannose synthase [Chlorobiaceae bacterium]
MQEKTNDSLHNDSFKGSKQKSQDALALVIIPTFNESENIGRLLKEISSLYPKTVDLLVIDDNSPDGTAEIVRSLQQEIRSLYLLEREKKLGLGTAYIAGFQYALKNKYRYVLEMDADFSHDPKEIGVFLEAMRSADLVIGSRYMNNTVNVVNWPLGRLILSKMASYYSRIITGLPIDDPTSGFKCFSADVLRALDLGKVHSQGYSFQIEINFRVWKKGYTIREIPIIFVDRSVGKSKMTKRNIREAIWIVWLLKIKSLVGLM